MSGEPGDRPDPNSTPCGECGHVWFEGERQHQYVDGDPGNQVLCALCLQQRRLARPDQ
jgi:hypothetical protein